MLKNIQSEIGLHVAKLQRLYATLPTRRQHAVWLVLLIVVIAMCWSVVIEPLHQWQQFQFRRWQATQQDVMWVEAQKPKAALLAQYRQQGGEKSATPLLSLVTASAKAQSLAINRYEPKDDNELAIWMEGVPYSQFMQWLRQLMAQDASMRIRALSLRAGDKPGLVTVNVELTR